jgi:NAD(P)-dependent dehydrogenase (short-subunit alcohol dehydrogenase family)
MSPLGTEMSQLKASLGPSVQEAGASPPLRAVVTGGSSGIGLATVKALRARGVDTYDFSRSTGVDVRDDVAVANAYDDLEGVAQFLVASAGIIAPGPKFPEANLDSWYDVMETNVMGVVIAVGAHVRRLQEARLPGKIVLLGSPSGKRPSMENLAYGTSKAAVSALGIGLARGLEVDGIKVYIVCPSHVDTPMLRHRGFDDLDAHKLLTAQSVAEEIAYLLLEPNNLDGQVLYSGGEVRMKQE